MIDITHKSSTLRSAVAEGVVKVSEAETIKKVREGRIPKGNVFERARTAGLLGVKKTADLVPDCHPIPIEYAAVEFEVHDLEIHIRMTVKAICKTGVEVEAMHGVSIVALTMYDMLKPVDSGVEIRQITLLSKAGGKTSRRPNVKGIRASVVVCSDSVFNGEKEDRAGKSIQQILEGYGVKAIAYTVIPDEADWIKAKVLSNKENLLIFTGGTGAGPRDVTPDTIKPLLDFELPGISETIRRYGQDRMPYAMLSRSLAGVRNEKLILSVPGSKNGATEAMEAVLPHIFHVFHVMKGKKNG